MYPLCNATATPQARSCSDLLLHFIVMKRATKDRHRMPSKLRPPAAKPTYLPTYLSASRPPAAKKPTYLPFVRAYPDLRRSRKNRTLWDIFCEGAALWEVFCKRGHPFGFLPKRISIRNQFGIPHTPALVCALRDGRPKNALCLLSTLSSAVPPTCCRR